MEGLFFDIGLVIMISTLAGIVARLLKQPLIPSYILTGLFIGPILGLVKNPEILVTFEEFGIAFLLFFVGLEIDLKKLKSVGPVAIVGGSLRIILLFFLGLVCALVLHFSRVESIFLGMVVAFSSTMVVIKILSDNKELSTLHGRIILAMLLVEDVFAIFALSAVSSWGALSLTYVITILGKGILLFALAYVLARLVLPYLFRFVAHSQELLFLSSISICFAFSLLFHHMGLSVAIGAFIGGVMIGSLPYNFQVIGKVKSLKDFFAAIFFVSLGVQITFAGFQRFIPALFAFLLFVIVFKTIFIFITAMIFGYKKRTSFLTAISLTQISEFSMIIMSIGVVNGIVSHDLLSFTIILGMITITITAYLINYDYKIYEFLAKPLGFFERLEQNKQELEYMPKESKKDILLLGADRVGHSIFNKLKNMKQEFLVVDYNPEIIKRLIKEKVPCIYGDIGDLEIIERLHLKKVRLLISTIPNEAMSILLIKKARKHNKTVLIFVTANRVEEALRLYDVGADYVILPHFLGGDHVSLMLEDISTDISKIVKKKIDHIKDLHNRKEIGHEHPHHHHP